MTKQLAKRIQGHLVLPDNDQWTNRIEVRSETSNRVYVVAQHKKGRYWRCSCMGCIRFQHCKHLEALGLPAYRKPYEITEAKKKSA